VRLDVGSTGSARAVCHERHDRAGHGTPRGVAEPRPLGSAWLEPISNDRVPALLEWPEHAVRGGRSAATCRIFGRGPRAQRGFVPSNWPGVG